VAFEDDIALRPQADGGYEGEILETWWNPRGPLGGYVMALMQQAVVLAVDDETRQPRSLTVSFLRPPQAGPFTVHPMVVRAGRSLSSASVTLEQEGKPLAIGLATLSTPWSGPLLNDSPMPRVDPPGARQAPPNPPPGAPRVPFRDLVTMQKRFGPELFSRAEVAEAGGWLGLREERPVDALTVLILADAWFPAPWPRLAEFAPAPTVEMSVYFRAPLPMPDSLLLGRFESPLVRDGFFDESGELWAPDGTLVAQSRQLGLLLGAP
jgi:acyl-CoA thioesterase